MAGDKTLDYTTCQFDQARQFSRQQSQAAMWIPLLPTGPGHTVTAPPLPWQSKHRPASRLLGAPVLKESAPSISFS